MYLFSESIGRIGAYSQSACMLYIRVIIHSGSHSCYKELGWRASCILFYSTGLAMSARVDTLSRIFFFLSYTKRADLPSFYLWNMHFSLKNEKTQLYNYMNNAIIVSVIVSFSYCLVCFSILHSTPTLTVYKNMHGI